MKKQIVVLSLLAALVAVDAGAAAKDDDKPYTEGPVTNVSFIRVKDGKNLDYMNYLKGTWKAYQEGAKKAGLVTEYHVYSAEPRTPNDANVILTVTHPNWAAFDKVAEFDAVTVKVEGSIKAADKSFGDRASIRDVIGSQNVQELILK
jgi:hypothetical protein